MSPELKKRMEEAAQQMVEACCKNEGDNYQEHKDSFEEGAEWMHREEVVPLQTALSVAHEALLWADEMFTARDEMNAKVHCSPIRLSPITLRVKQARELLEKMKGGER